MMKLGLVRSDSPVHSRQTLAGLLGETDFADVTLVCEDHRQVPAHKVILSSGSEFFRALLLANPHPHPLVYLRLPYGHLQAVLQFLYQVWLAWHGMVGMVWLAWCIACAPGPV